MGGQGLSIKRSLFSKTKLCDILGNLHKLNETAPKKKGGRKHVACQGSKSFELCGSKCFLHKVNICNAWNFQLPEEPESQLDRYFDRSYSSVIPQCCRPGWM